MANMSYCRFQNTLQDLQDCYEVMLNGDSDDDDELSKEEEQAKQELLKLCQKIVLNFCEDAE